MNVAAHQEKEKNDNTKSDKKKVEERRQAIDFKEDRCCSSAVVQGAVRQKMVSVREVLGITGTFGKTNSHFDPTQTGSRPHHHVDWCSLSCPCCNGYSFRYNCLI